MAVLSIHYKRKCVGRAFKLIPFSSIALTFYKTWDSNLSSWKEELVSKLYM